MQHDFKYLSQQYCQIWRGLTNKLIICGLFLLYTYHNNAAENKLMEKENENENINNTLSDALSTAAALFGDEMAEETNDKWNMEDVSGEYLQDVIIDDENNNKNEMGNQSENIHNEIREEVYRASEYNKTARYLLMNKIRAVIVHKRSEENEVSNDMMNAFAAGKYCIDIDFFDQSKYSRSIPFKTDYNFICCDMKSNGILFGGTLVDDIKEYYGNFTSEKL